MKAALQPSSPSSSFASLLSTRSLRCSFLGRRCRSPSEGFTYLGTSLPPGLEARLQAQEQKIATLESDLRDKDRRLDRLARHLGEVDRQVRQGAAHSFSVAHYNILAGYLGRNTQPWFLYGADVDKATRSEIMHHFYARDPAGQLLNAGWPNYVRGILTQGQIEAVEAYDRMHFEWKARRRRILETILRLDSDILSLVELDDFAWFKETLAGPPLFYQGLWHKRPRKSSLDGCAIFWRDTQFRFVDSLQMDFHEGIDRVTGRQRPSDRSCIAVLLSRRPTPSGQVLGHSVQGTSLELEGDVAADELPCGKEQLLQPLIVISTHLAKDDGHAKDRESSMTRVREVAQLVQRVSDFAEKHDVVDTAAVVLMGDMNTRHLGRIRGIARVAFQLARAPHPFLWNALEVPTGPTTVTEARRARIDVVMYQPTLLSLEDAAQVPILKPGDRIPNADHPSDHFPVRAVLRPKKDHWRIRDCAQEWFACVFGEGPSLTLNHGDLRSAFTFFDPDEASMICMGRLRDGFGELCTEAPGLEAELLLSALGQDTMSLGDFVAVYESQLSMSRTRVVTDMERAFSFLDVDGNGRLSLSELRCVFEAVLQDAFDEENLIALFRRCAVTSSADEEAMIKIEDFIQACCHEDAGKLIGSGLRSSIGQKVRSMKQERRRRLGLVSAPPLPSIADKRSYSSSAWHLRTSPRQWDSGRGRVARLALSILLGYRTTFRRNAFNRPSISCLSTSSAARGLASLRPLVSVAAFRTSFCHSLAKTKV